MEDETCDGRVHGSQVEANAHLALDRPALGCLVVRWVSVEICLQTVVHSRGCISTEKRIAGE